jgi:hypothetical protein
MSKLVLLQSIHEPHIEIKGIRYSKLTCSVNREKAIEACRELTNELYPRLDLRKEIYSVEKPETRGQTILIYEKRNNNDDEASTVMGPAICHGGPRTEARSGTYYIKFGAVRATENASKHFGYLLDICQLFAKTQDYLAWWLV